MLHCLAHAGAGVWAAGPVWLIAMLWWLSTALYISAGLGLLVMEPAHFIMQYGMLRGVKRRAEG